ncbi:MAG: HAMP domain-containing protein, partial [Spirochaetaceae bacterium]|nr:HAMP domain-containing protein [Spirochaetaceae bacterium]
MKIGKKLILMIMIMNLIGVVALTGTILNLAKKQIYNLTNSEITNLAREHALAIKVWLELYLDAVRTTGQFMSKYEEINPADRRPIFNMMLRALVEENAEIAAASSVWEPNALDGLDAEFVNTPGTDQTGRFLSYWFRTDAGPVLEPLTDYETPVDGDYYLEPKRTGNETLVEPYMYRVNGQDILMTTVAMPVKNKNRFLGCINVDLGMEVIQRSVERIKPHEGTVAMLYTNKGLVGAHFDTNRVGKSMMETEQDIAGPYLNDLRNAIGRGEMFSFTNYVPRLNENMFFVNVPIVVGNTTTPWALMLGIPNNVIAAPVYRMLLIGIIIAVLMLCMISMGALFLARAISSPLNRMALVLNDIGEGDLTKRLEAHSKDEIGDMTRSFNSTLDKVRN